MVGLTLRIERQRGGSINVVLIECPACHADLDGKKTSHHILTEHGPEDFGLSPMESEPAVATDGGERR